MNNQVIFNLWLISSIQYIAPFFFQTIPVTYFQTSLVKVLMISGADHSLLFHIQQHNYKQQILGFI